MSTKAAAPPLVVRTGEGERSLAAGRTYLVGRDPQADIVIADPRVSWHHAELRAQNGRWALVDLGSTNGSYADGRRADLIEIDGTRQVRLGDPEDGRMLDYTLLEHTGGQARRIGRVPDNDIVVPHVSVSRHHAELRTTPGGYRIVDLGSHNGTFVNEQRVSAATLAEGDTVGFGDTTFRLSGGELLQIADPAPARHRTQPAPPTRSNCRRLPADDVARSECSSYGFLPFLASPTWSGRADHVLRASTPEPARKLASRSHPTPPSSGRPRSGCIRAAVTCSVRCRAAARQKRQADWVEGT